METASRAVQTLAAELSAAFITKERNTGATFHLLAPGSPAWMSEAIFAVHAAVDDRGPDDSTYAAIAEVAETLAECSPDATEDDLWDAITGIEPDVYNSDLGAWLGANLLNASYVDEYVEEHGWPQQGLYVAIQGGQSAFVQAVASALMAELQKLSAEVR